MKTTQTGGTALLAAAMLLLAGCGGDTGTEEPAETQAPPATEAPSEPGTTTESASPGMTEGGGETGGQAAGGTATTLATADSDLGQIVVDGEGMTVYYFTKDVADSGESACTGDCLAAWPPVLAEEEPELDGVTAEVGLIDTPDGQQQVTLNGMPIYYWAQDKAPGDTTGQGVNDVWYVVAPDGEMIQ